MKISFEKPPCYDEANKLFKLDELNLGTVFTYGDTLYNPSKVPIDRDLLVHEETHGHQHQHDATVAKLWWERYIKDPQFRLEQEAEAYGKQYAYLCTVIKDRNKRYRALRSLASALSGPMYGSIVKHSEAEALIRKAAGGGVH